MGDVVIDELLVFSDHHGHPFTYGAKEVAFQGHFVNSRLLESRKVLEEISAYADLYNIKKIVFGGDLLHVREAVPTDAVVLTMTAIHGMVSKGKELFAVTGNHDYFDRAGYIHSMEMLKYMKNVHVFDPTCPKPYADCVGRSGDPYRLHFVPYTDDRTTAVERLQQAGERTAPGKRPDLLFAHLGMQGAKVGSDYVLVSDNDISVDDVPYDKFAGCFFGHYHQHQQLFKNGWYIGASHQHNWGDVNTKRGFLHVTVYVDYVDFKFIETSAPRFVSFRDDNPVMVRSKDFVRVLTSRKMTDKQTEEVRDELGTETCEVVYLPPEVTMSAMALSEENLSPEHMLSAWVDANEAWLKQNLPDVAQDDLVSYGRSMLASVTEKL